VGLHPPRARYGAQQPRHQRRQRPARERNGPPLGASRPGRSHLRAICSPGLRRGQLAHLGRRARVDPASARLVDEPRA
jgi:hypothetical protein